MCLTLWHRKRNLYSRIDHHSSNCPRNVLFPQPRSSSYGVSDKTHWQVPVAGVSWPTISSQPRAVPTHQETRRKFPFVYFFMTLRVLPLFVLFQGDCSSITSSQYTIAHVQYHAFEADISPVNYTRGGHIFESDHLTDSIELCLQSK